KKAPNIVLVEGQRDGGAYLKWETPIYVYNEDGTNTKEINRIYGRED
ncbi:SAM-dependent methyltransferase, partial [Clostridium sp. HCS.1]